MDLFMYLDSSVKTCFSVAFLPEKYEYTYSVLNFMLSYRNYCFFFLTGLLTLYHSIPAFNPFPKDKFWTLPN